MWDEEPWNNIANLSVLDACESPPILQWDSNPNSLTEPGSKIFKNPTIFFFFFFCLQNENDEILKYLFPTEVQIKQTKKIKFCICSQLVEGEQQPIFIK